MFCCDKVQRKPEKPVAFACTVSFMLQIPGPQPQKGIHVQNKDLVLSLRR